MIERLKTWILTWTFVDNAVREKAFKHFLDATDDTDKDADKILCREILKVKDFSQVHRQLSPDQRKTYVADASVAYRTQAFLDIVNEIQYEQLVFMGLQSENDRQLMIGRGTINGADLIEARMRELDAEHQQNIADNQPVDGSQTFEPISKLESN